MDLNEPEMGTTDLPFAELLPAITEDIARGLGGRRDGRPDPRLGRGHLAHERHPRASLRPDVDDMIGLPANQIVQYLVAPRRSASEFETAISKLKEGFHLHRDPRDGRLYYSPTRPSRSVSPARPRCTLQPDR